MYTEENVDHHLSLFLLSSSSSFGWCCVENTTGCVTGWGLGGHTGAHAHAPTYSRAHVKRARWITFFVFRAGAIGFLSRGISVTLLYLRIAVRVLGVLLLIFRRR